MAADLKTIISDSDKLLGKMAEGDYTVSSDMEDKYTGDPIGLLMAMRQMKAQMNDVLADISMRYHHLLQQVLTTLLRQHRKSQKVLWISQQPLRSFSYIADITGGVRKHLRSSMIHTDAQDMLRKRITAIQRCRAWLTLSDT